MHRRKKRKARDESVSYVCVFSTLVAVSGEDLGEDGIQEEPG